MNATAGLVLMVALMALFIAFSYWFFRQIRNGRIDLADNPRYSPPPSPHPLRGTGMPPRLEYDDDHTSYHREDD